MLNRTLKYISFVFLNAIMMFTLSACESPTKNTQDNGNDLLIGTYDGETAEGGDCVWVEPYHRSDGTCVRGHWRSAPDRDCSLVGSVLKPCP